MKYGFHLLVLQPCQPVGIHVISITSSGLAGAGRRGEIMRWRESQNTPNGGSSGPKSRETGLPAETPSGRVHCACDRAEGDRHWLCAVWHRITAERKRSGSNGVKVKKWLGSPRRPEMNGAGCRGFSSLAVNRSRKQFALLWSQRETRGDILQSLVYLKKESPLMKSKVYVCWTCFVVNYFTFYFRDYRSGKNRFTRTNFAPGTKRISGANACLSPSELEHEICI